MATTTAAATLQKKKIHKGKLKKTIKNVLCRPDPIFWPTVTEEERQATEKVLSKYKIQIPEFKKSLWKDLKTIPKEKRPKPPKIEKVEGLLFGITECSNMIQCGQCSAVIIEAAVNPPSIVQPILEACTNARIPVICIDGLRKTTAAYFGIPTSCLGVKKDCLTEISDHIFKLGNNKLPQEKCHEIMDVEMNEVKSKDSVMLVDTQNTQESNQFEYLYRTDKKSRVFVPPSDGKVSKGTKQFIGQDFIEFGDKPDKKDQKKFKKMIVKRISNNPNRVKVK